MESTTPSTTPNATEHRNAGAVIASILSTVFSPLLVPTYGGILAVTLSMLRYLPGATRFTVVGVIFAITCMLPLVSIIVLWKLKIIGDPQLNNRTERTIPYLITILCYMGCGYYLYQAHAPSWLWALMAGGALASVVCASVNTRWKISAHMTAMGGLTALVFRLAADGVQAVDLNGWLMAVVIAAGAVGASRVYLLRHTLWQVIDGFAVGFLCVFLLSML